LTGDGIAFAYQLLTEAHKLTFARTGRTYQVDKHLQVKEAVLKQSINACQQLKHLALVALHRCPQEFMNLWTIHPQSFQGVA
jgi:hypothetical protein